MPLAPSGVAAAASEVPVWMSPGRYSPSPLTRFDVMKSRNSGTPVITSPMTVRATASAGKMEKNAKYAIPPASTFPRASPYLL
jgi:hypothetical protein